MATGEARERGVIEFAHAMVLTTEPAALNPGRRRAICGADMDSPSADTPAQRGPLPAFRAMVAAGELAPDASQERVAQRLQTLWTRLRGYDPPPRPANGISLFARLLRREPPPDQPNGLYIVGEVGRGKSMLMDLFFALADVRRKQRIHFHRFMQNVHARFHAFRRANPDIDDPIPPLADSVAADAALLCFDEFQVNDIADAMILGRLFQALFERGVVVVATSNIAPDDLFKGQPGRDAFLPFIALIKRRLDVVMMDAGRDFRRLRHAWPAHLAGAGRCAGRPRTRPCLCRTDRRRRGQARDPVGDGPQLRRAAGGGRRGALRLRPAVRHRARRRRLPGTGGSVSTR